VAHPSGDAPLEANLELQLIPDAKSTSWDKNALGSGKRIMVIANTRNNQNRSDHLSIDPGPSRTCVWVENKGNELWAVLISPTNKKRSLKIEYVEHADPHPYPCAAWKSGNELGACPAESPDKPWDLLEDDSTKISTEFLSGQGMWSTCSTNGCCKL
jgi:hypothetical protein